MEVHKRPEHALNSAPLAGLSAAQSLGRCKLLTHQEKKVLLVDFLSKHNRLQEAKSAGEAGQAWDGEVACFDYIAGLCQDSRCSDVTFG